MTRVSIWTVWIESYRINTNKNLRLLSARGPAHVYCIPELICGSCSCTTRQNWTIKPCMLSIILIHASFSYYYCSSTCEAGAPAGCLLSPCGVLVFSRGQLWALDRDDIPRQLDADVDVCEGSITTERLGAAVVVQICGGVYGWYLGDEYLPTWKGGKVHWAVVCWTYTRLWIFYYN